MAQTRITSLLLLCAVLASCGDGADIADAGADSDAVSENDGAVDGGFEADAQAPDFGPYPEPAIEGLIVGVEEEFWANTDDFVRLAGEHGVQLYWTLLSANHYNDRPRRALGQAIIRRPQSFFENAAIPMLQRYAGTGVIWAVDCMNEPEAMIAGADGNYEGWGVSWAEMRAFLRYCADIIHARVPGLQVSAGSGWHDWDNVAAGRYDGLSFDFLDYHYYADAPSAPTASDLGVALPVIIGECGQASDTRDDAVQRSALEACFESAVSGGYRAALGWYYDYPGSANEHAHVNGDGSWRPVRQVYEEYASSTLVTGLNLAWLSGAYDHDFGPNPLHPEWGVGYDHAEAEAALADYDEVGIGVMRLWAFEGQEALPFHSVFDDFEAGPAGWVGDGVTVTESGLWPGDGDAGLALGFDTSTSGWHGIARSWTADTPLDLSRASTWRYSVHNALGQAVGVNLAFVVGDGAGAPVYQTRSGVSGGQLWIADGASLEQTVTLAAEAFADQWALASAPDVGVPRPADAALGEVRELRIRVYLSAAQLPVNGTLYVDAVRIR